MKYARLAFLLALSMWFTNPMIAQSDENEPEEEISDEHKDANELYEARQYAFAAELFQEAYSEANSREEKGEIAYKLAECYRWMSDYRKAESQYRRAHRLDYGSICLLRQAEMKKMQGDYEDAIELYQEFKEEAPGDPRADAGIRSARQSRDWMDNPPTRYQVENLGRDINSREPDLAPRYAGRRGRETDVLFFTSQREEATGKDESGFTTFNFGDIFSIEKERRRPNDPNEGAWSTPVQIDGDEEIVNTPDHEGVVAFDSRGSVMYFTRCQVIRRAHMGCSIWTSRKAGVSWMAPEPVVITSDSSISVGHPTLSTDDEILYFSGNLDGAKNGSKDLWMTSYDRRTRSWKEPTNLGDLVNTDGDELYPYIHDDGNLYFSSNGHGGMGGLDIFKVALDENGMPTGEVRNLMWPINSPGNDYGLIFEPGDTSKGFMTSDWEDRDEHRGADDLYSVYLVPLEYTISGLVTSTKDRSPIPQVTVTLEGGDAPIVVNTDADGYYSFSRDQLEPGVVYKIRYEKKKFLSGEANATTVGVPLSAHELVIDEEGDYYIHNITVNVGIDPIEVPIVLPNVLFETAKWDLNADSRAALDTVVQTLNRNPNIVIELRSHTDYTDTKERNQILSQKRADTCVSYLVSKGIDSARLVPRGMGEDEPYVIPEDYDGLYSEDFEAGRELSESWIKSQSNTIEQKANQLNRRTDMKVLRDDYVPAQGTASGEVAEGEGEGAGEESGPVVGEFHTIQGRESIGRIARQYDVSVRDLKELNGGLRGVRLVDGMILKITPGADYSEFDRTHYQVQRGDEIDDIAEELGIDEDVLEELNPDIDLDRLPPGLYLRIE